jgi:hypothetical protein
MLFSKVPKSVGTDAEVRREIPGGKGVLFLEQMDT